VSTRQLPEHLQRLEDEPEVGPEKRVLAMVTVTGPRVGRNGRPEDSHPRVVTVTFPALVRTRLIYKGRLAFLAADPEGVSS
jgi:hypothetical protein